MLSWLKTSQIIYRRKHTVRVGRVLHTHLYPYPHIHSCKFSCNLFGITNWSACLWTLCGKQRKPTWTQWEQVNSIQAEEGLNPEPCCWEVTVLPIMSSSQEKCPVTPLSSPAVVIWWVLAYKRHPRFSFSGTSASSCGTGGRYECWDQTNTSTIRIRLIISKSIFAQQSSHERSQTALSYNNYETIVVLFVQMWAIDKKIILIRFSQITES